MAMALDPEDESLPKLKKLAERKAKAQELKKQAEHECDAGDYAKAVDTFNAALKYDPHNKVIIQERDDAMEKDSEVKHAKAAADAEAAKKTKAADLKRRAREMMLMGPPRCAEAAKTYGTAAQLDPEDDEIAPLQANAKAKAKAQELLEQGKHEAEAKDYAGAVATLDDALKAFDAQSVPEPYPQLQELRDEIVANRDSTRKKQQAADLKAQGDKELADGEYAKAADTLLASLKLDYNKDAAMEQAIAAKKAKAADLKAQADQMMKDEEFHVAAKTYAMAMALDPEDESLPKLKKLAERKDKAQELKKQAEHECDAGDYAKAVDTFNAALKYDPHNKVIIQERDDAMRKAEELKHQHDAEAAAAAKKAKAADLKAQADKMMADGDSNVSPETNYSEAAKLYATAFELDPEDESLPKLKKLAERKAKAQELKKQAEHECDAGDYAKAVDTFDAALKYDTRNAQIKAERDAAYRKAQALKLKAEGEDLMGQQKYADAVKVLLDAMHMDPDNEEIAAEEAEAAQKKKAAELKEVGKKMMNDGDYAGAVKTFSVAQELDPSDEELPILKAEAERLAKLEQLLELADHQVDAKDYAGAVDTLKQAVELSPDDEDIQRRLKESTRKAKALKLKQDGEKCMAAGDYENAVACFTKSLKADPSNPEVVAEEKEAEKKAKAAALKKQADAKLKEGDETASTPYGPQHDLYINAAKLYGEAIALDPDDSTFPPLKKEAEDKARACELLEQGKHEKAAKDFENAIESFEAAKTLLDPYSRSGLNDEIDQELAEAKKIVADMLAADEAARSEEAKKAKAAELKKQAQELMDQGDYNGAAKLYALAIALDDDDESLPKLMKLAKKLAKCQELKEQAEHEMALGHFDDAIKTFEKALRFDHHNKEIESELKTCKDMAEALKLREEGRKQMESKEFQDAIATFDRGLALNLIYEEPHDEVLVEMAPSAPVDALHSGLVIDHYKTTAVAAIWAEEQVCTPLERTVHVKADNWPAELTTAALTAEFRGFGQIEAIETYGDTGGYATVTFHEAKSVAAALMKPPAKVAGVPIDLSAYSFKDVLAQWQIRCKTAVDGQARSKDLVDDGIALYNKDKFAEARDKFEAAARADAGNQSAADWLEKARAKLKAIDDEKEKVVVNAAESTHEEIEAAAQKVAARAFDDLGLAPALPTSLPSAPTTGRRRGQTVDLSVPQTLNYMKFINWFKKQMKLGDKRVKISDYTLQTTMKLWKDFDKTGLGLTADGLGGVMTGMIKAGAVEVHTDGTFSVKRMDGPGA